MNQGNDPEQWVWGIRTTQRFELCSWLKRVPGEWIRCDKGQNTFKRNETGAVWWLNTQVLQLIRPLGMILNVQVPFKQCCSLFPRYPLRRTGDRCTQIRVK